MPIDQLGGAYGVLAYNNQWEVRSYSQPPEDWEMPAKSTGWFWDSTASEEDEARDILSGRRAAWDRRDYGAFRRRYWGGLSTVFRGRLLVRVPRAAPSLSPEYARVKLAELDKEEAELGKKMKYLGTPGPPDVRLARQWVSFYGGRFAIPAGVVRYASDEEREAYEQAGEFNRWAEARGLVRPPRTNDRYWDWFDQYLRGCGIAPSRYV